MSIGWKLRPKGQGKVSQKIRESPLNWRLFKAASNQVSDPWDLNQIHLFACQELLFGKLNPQSSSESPKLRLICCTNDAIRAGRAPPFSMVATATWLKPMHVLPALPVPTGWMHSQLDGKLEAGRVRSLKDLPRFCGAKQLNGRDSCNRCWPGQANQTKPNHAIQPAISFSVSQILRHFMTSAQWQSRLFASNSYPCPHPWPTDPSVSPLRRCQQINVTSADPRRP